MLLQWDSLIATLNPQQQHHLRVNNSNIIPAIILQQQQQQHIQQQQQTIHILVQVVVEAIIAPQVSLSLTHPP